MRHHNILKLSVLVILCLMVSGQTAFGQGIKERMKKRLPVIADLKTKGIIGENNQGYLAYVGKTKAREEVIAAENKDRKAIYTYFAKQQKTSVGVVEQVQAKRKAQKANPGEYIQNPAGQWVRK
ncbi:YdbL family protein [Desulfospira joergensenii]|uniref:YdbL family protein n=1 Tax=Desulfospira joergensenii TaxID=53329 RepID=UPI0003B38E18|nr:YdbL family protein [Desulfospira joergensenii]